MIVTLAGGVGAAKMLSGLIQVVDPAQVTAVVNVGDDLVLHGLEISPDLDTVTYTLAGAIDPDRGWGLAEESWQAMDLLRRYGGEAWFGLGDRDLGTHLYRTARRRAGATLTEVTAEIAAAWDLGLRIVPVTDDELRTRVTITGDGGEPQEISFQEYFVGRQHSVPVQAVRFEGAEAARPGPGVLEALEGAERVVIAPSNPIVSIGPVLAVPGVRRGGGGPPGRRGGRVPDRGRIGAQGPGRPPAERAGPRVLGGGRGPPVRRAGRHPGGRHR